MNSNEQRYRAATELLGGYVYEAEFLEPGRSEVHRLIWASDGFERIFGFTVDEYNREGHWQKFYHPDDCGAANTRTAALQRGETVEAEVRLMHSSGEIRWLHVLNRPIIDPTTRRVTGVLGLGHDITPRKAAEQAAKKSELALRSLTSNLSDWLLLLGTDLKVQFLNREFLGCSPDQLSGKDPFAALDDRQRRRIVDVLGLALSAGSQVRTEIDLGEEAAPLYLELSGAPVMENGSIAGLALRISDITERRTTESTLRTHAMILATMQEGVIMFDGAGIVRFANRAAHRLFGYDDAEFVGVSLARLGLGSAGFAAGAREVNCRRRDGSSFTGGLIFNALELQDGPMFIGVVKDMTERKVMERELIDFSSREQNRIASALHDGLGQELTGVALLLRSLTGRIAREFPPCQRDAEEVIALVNQAIANSRLLAQGMSPVNLGGGGLPEALTALAAGGSKLYGSDVRSNSRPSKGVCLDESTADHLYRIAQEAMLNAVRHGRAAQVRIDLTMGSEELLLSIADDGRGLPDESQSARGMGLRIMRHRAELIGAGLTLERRESGGTLVECRLPADRLAGRMPAPPGQGSSLQRAAKSKRVS